MRIMLMGAPGCGKGTLATRLEKEYGIKHISTGDIFRNEIKEDTEIGRAIKTYMISGKLVPDEIALRVVKKVISNLDSYMLDGFPRNESQAKDFDWISSNINKALDKVLHIEVDYDILMKRLTGRRTCMECKAIYNVYSNPPVKQGVCDKCTGCLIQRGDDEENVIKKRLETYIEQTEPLRYYYGYKGILRVLSSDGTPDEVYERAKKILDTIK